MANIASDATASASFSTTSTYFSSLGTASALNDENITHDNRFGVYHTDSYTTTQESSVTIVAELDFTSSTTTKRHACHCLLSSSFYLDNYFNVEFRLYSWTGSAWLLDSTQNKSITEESEKNIDYTFGFFKDVELSATKYRVEAELDYKLNYRASTDELVFQISEWQAFSTLEAVDVNLFQDTTKTLTGSPIITQSQDYMVDGFTDIGSYLLAPTTDLVVYDIITTFDTTYSISSLSCNMIGDGSGFERYGAYADVDWEFQVYTTEWVSVETGSFAIDGETVATTASAEFTPTNATKSRFVVSLSNISLVTSFPTLNLNNFSAFTSDTTAIDIGLHIGSETIGATVANESPLKIYVNGTTYSLPLVATTDSTASATRIYTDSVKALRKIS